MKQGMTKEEVLALVGQYIERSSDTYKEIARGCFINVYGLKLGTF
jgi:hypothetical protein